MGRHGANGYRIPINGDAGKIVYTAEVDDIAMMRLLAREGFALAVLPPIAVRDELAAGTLVEVASLEGLVETFFAVTTGRRFPNPVIRLLLDHGAGSDHLR